MKTNVKQNDNKHVKNVGTFSCIMVFLQISKRKKSDTILESIVLNKRKQKIENKMQITFMSAPNI